MFQIENTLISLDLINEKFCCDIQACKGACCVHGDSGAPLLKEEIKVLEKEIKHIYKFLQPKGVKAIKKQGVFVIDDDNGVAVNRRRLPSRIQPEPEEYFAFAEHLEYRVVLRIIRRVFGV